MKFKEINLGITYSGETEITWIKVERIFESELERRKYKEQRYKEILKEKQLCLPQKNMQNTLLW